MTCTNWHDDEHMRILCKIHTLTHCARHVCILHNCRLNWLEQGYAQWVRDLHGAEHQLQRSQAEQQAAQELRARHDAEQATVGNRQCLLEACMNAPTHTFKTSHASYLILLFSFILVSTTECIPSNRLSTLPTLQ
eukprot:21024-Heterococcus_DN1.PRE.2